MPAPDPSLDAKVVPCPSCSTSVGLNDVRCFACGAERPDKGWDGRAGRAREFQESTAVPLDIPLPPTSGASEEDADSVFEPDEEEATDDPASFEPVRIRVVAPDDAFDDDDQTALREVHLEPDAPLVPGQMFARRYRIQECTTELGNARLYLAVQEPMVRRVMVCVLRTNLPDDVAAALEEQFLRDAQALATAADPELARVFDFGRLNDGTCYAVWEVVYGLTLREILHWGPLDVARLLPMFQQIAKAMVALERVGVVHRALRAEHVVVQPLPGGTESARVTGYGLDAIPETFEDTTDANAAKYAAPELRRGEEAEVSADIYAFGVLLYKAVSGRVPYDNLQVDEILDAQEREPFPDFPEEVRSLVPRSLEQITRRCMEKERAARYSSAQALCDDLVRVTHELYPQRPLLSGPVATPPAPPVSAPPLTHPSGLPKVQWALAVAATVFLVVPVGIGTGVWVGLRVAEGSQSDHSNVILQVAPRQADPPPASAEPAFPVAPPDFAWKLVSLDGAASPSVEHASHASTVARSSSMGRSSFVEPASSSRDVVAPPADVAEPVVDDASVVVSAPRALGVAAPDLSPLTSTAANSAAESAVVPPAVRDPLSGRWTGTVAGSDSQLDLVVWPDGTVRGSALVWVEHYELKGTVNGSINRGERVNTLELQVTVDGTTSTYSGDVENDSAKGRVFVGGDNEGRFSLHHE